MRNSLINTLISLVISLGVVWAFNHWKTEKIGYVKSGVIINDYEGMKSANAQFTEELKIVQANIDTLKNRYLKLKEQESVVPEKEKADWAYQLGIAKSEYEKYEQRAIEQTELRKQELSNKVLQEVNAFIQDYGKKNNYKLILGTTNDGSILYGDEADDLTMKIIDMLNKQKGK